MPYLSRLYITGQTAEGWSEESSPLSLAINSDRDREELRSGQPVKYLYSMSHIQNLSSISGQHEFVNLLRSNSLIFQLQQLSLQQPFFYQLLSQHRCFKQLYLQHLYLQQLSLQQLSPVLCLSQER